MAPIGFLISETRLNQAPLALWEASLLSLSPTLWEDYLVEDELEQLELDTDPFSVE